MNPIMIGIVEKYPRLGYRKKENPTGLELEHTTRRIRNQTRVTRALITENLFRMEYSQNTGL